MAETKTSNGATDEATADAKTEAKPQRKRITRRQGKRSQIVVEGRAPADVARELGITLAAAYAAKSRVLHRLRQELEGMLD